MALPEVGPGACDPQVAEQVEVQTKYAGYIERQRAEIERQRRHESLILPEELDYARVSGLSAEVSQKLAEARPHTLGQAARVPGVTPAAISLLLVYLKKRRWLDARRSA
jgi:tRNA uridine 5-carboxymethylaminomethyl modification enzyme